MQDLISVVNTHLARPPWLALPACDRAVLQAAVSAGRLRLVLWEEVPHFIAQDTQLRHPYASQVRPHASNPVPEYARKGKALTPCMRHMRVGNGTRARMSTVFRSAGQPMHVHV